MNGELDVVGCAYGRETRKILEEFRQSCIKKTTRTNERLRHGSERFSEIEDSLKEVVSEVKNLQQRFSWMLGAYAVGGSILGQVLLWLAQHLIK